MLNTRKRIRERAGGSSFPRITATLRYMNTAGAAQPDEVAELDEILALPIRLEALLLILTDPVILLNSMLSGESRESIAEMLAT